MGLFDRFRRRPDIKDKAGTLTPDDILLAALINNETIDRDKAMMLPAVSSAVDLISSSVAAMPVRLYWRKDSGIEEIPDDQRVRLLNGDTGDTLNAYQMKKSMVADMLMGKKGGGYAYIRRQKNTVVSLHYVEDGKLTIYKNDDQLARDYYIQVDGHEEKFRPYDFIKLLRNTRNGWDGKPVTEEVTKALQTAYRTLLYQLNLVETGGNKKGFLKSKAKLGQAEINALREAWRNLYTSSEENVVVLNNGLEFQESSNTSVEMQLNESKRTLNDEIRNVFHIYDDFARTFKEGIYPIVKAFEAALNQDLLLEKEKRNRYFELDIRETVRASIKERYEAYKLAKECGLMTINELRRMENLEDIPGMDVIALSLGSVLYNTETQTYYTPNTDTTAGTSGVNVSPEEGGAEDEQEEIPAE